MGVPVVPEAGGPRWGTLLLALFLAASQGLVVAFKVDTPYSLYVCPEGQNVTLTCRILDPVSKGHGVTFYKTWYLSSRGEVQVCKERRPIRNFTFHNLHLHHGSHQTANTSQDLAHTHGLESISDHHGNFSIIMHNLTLRDSGLYCCLVVEIKHHYSVHGAIELQVQTGKEAPSKCTAYQSSKQESDSKNHFFLIPSGNSFCSYPWPRLGSGLSPQYHIPMDLCSPSAGPIPLFS